jgi:hypothetical protein
MGQPPSCWRQGVARAAAKHRQRREQWGAEALPLWEQWRHDPFFFLGIGLYWGEGNKVPTDGKLRRLALSNSDPRLLRVWLRWCQRFLPRMPLRYDLNVHDGCDVAAARQFWKRELGVVVSSVTVAVSSASRRKRNSLPNGTLKVRVGRGSAECGTKMLAWIELVKLLQPATQV